MKHSAGLLIYREKAGAVQVFLVHPGGPFWAKKDIASWSIPKGEFEEGEDPLQAALREFVEETGLQVPAGDPLPLGPLQTGRKVVHTWYLQGDLDAATVSGNMFEMEWPPRSGKMQKFPEVDRAAWYGLAEARLKLHKGQVPIVDKLEHALGLPPTGPAAGDGQNRQDLTPG